jgi:porin-like protein
MSSDCHAQKIHGEGVNRSLAFGRLQQVEGVMVVQPRLGKLKMCAAVSAAFVLLSAGATYAADMDTMVTKAPPPAATTPPASCGSFYDFFLTACPLTWNGVTFYGTVDMGGTYQTRGTPFDPNFPTGASYFLNPPNRSAGFGLGPNAMSQSNVGIKVVEPVGSGWSFVANGQLAFDPYSLLLSNAPQALQNAIGVPLNQQLLPVDSSRWGWLAAENYLGFSSPAYGTLTFGRQNALLTDGVNAYDPMGGAYAFSPIGFSGKTCGAGDTEECRWTTAIKYRVNIGDFRMAVMGQPVTGSGAYNAYNPNTGAIEGQLGGDIKRLGPGVLSLDALGSYVEDAVNIGPAVNGAMLNASGAPITFPAGTYLKATVSNQTSFMALAKYSFLSAPDQPIAVKGPPPAPVVRLTLYAGYEWVEYSNPSIPQTSFRDDGFLFQNPNTTNAGNVLTMPGFNGTTINNNAFNAHCGTGGGCNDEIFQVFWTGAKYGITRDLDVIGAYYHYIQNQYTLNVGNVCANPTQHGQCAGTGDMASAVLDWRFLPKWDAYIGTFFSQLNGGLDNGYLSRNNLATTAGVRFRF